MKIFEKRNISIPEVISGSGFSIPVFSGSLGEPVVGIAKNLINPLIVINDSNIITRAFIFKHTKQIKDIKKIGIYQAVPGYQSIIFYFNESSDDINTIRINNPFRQANIESFNLLNEGNLKQLVKFFNNKGVLLTNEAKELLNK
jgi:hypothetical protein